MTALENTAAPASWWRKLCFWGAAALLCAVVCRNAVPAEKSPKPGDQKRTHAARRDDDEPAVRDAEAAEERQPLEAAAGRKEAGERPKIRLLRGEADDGPAEVEAVTTSQNPLAALWGPGGIENGLPLISGITILTVVPSILMMTTCFVRFTIVLGLLRQALGAQQLPPNSVLAALCLFLTFLVMRPVWNQSYEEGVRPYTQPGPGEVRPTLEEAAIAAARPVRQFMSDQIERAENSDAVWLLLEYQQASQGRSKTDRAESAPTYDDVAFPTLAAAYVLSELKVAFVIGFQILLPFVVIDLVVALLLTTLGMMMVPPTTVSFPFKLLLFVLIDGWMLTVGKLLASVGVAP